ncbi:Major facilitator superfamily domain general substrate transporter [Penicillium fimorum]|uniref:Major facilitator superfamily domain general substrate transporter n=1 Tax=Penicillium fimorum TaxID=1882269 RepID=A0A9W9Y8T4_9EURO|nr:Major facilitator superfamily domain general substrate transporter [Penicillium fimorum]
MMKQEHSSHDESEQSNQSPEAVGPQESQYLGPWKTVPVLVGLLLSTFCLGLDNTIIATANPRIAAQFNSFDDVGWYGSAYLLTTCAVSLLYGKLYTLFSVKWVYLIALFLFELGSLVCGITPNSVGLIVGRAVAGLGSGGLVSGAILVMFGSTPEDKRPLFTGILSGSYNIASIAGPLVGGAFTDKVSWRWCFYINLPCGLITSIFLFFFIPARPPLIQARGLKAKLANLDCLGNILFLGMVISLLLALQSGGNKYPWADAHVIAPFIVSGVLLLAFIANEIKEKDNAAIPPRIIKSRSIWGTSLFAFCISGAFFVFSYYLPIWFQVVKGSSAIQSGLMNLPLILSSVILSVLTGLLVTYIGWYNQFLLGCSVILTIGSGVMTLLGVHSGPNKWIGYQVIVGIGYGMGQHLPFVVASSNLAPTDVPTGTVIMSFIQFLSGAIFIALGEAVFQNRLLSSVRSSVPEIDPGPLLAEGVTKLRQQVSGDVLDRLLLCVNEATVRIFYIAVALSALSLAGAVVVEWKSTKRKA